MYLNSKLVDKLNAAKMGEVVRFMPAVANRDEVFKVITDAGFKIERLSNVSFSAKKVIASAPLLPSPAVKKSNDGPLSHDKLQAELFKWAWNTYPQIHYCIFAAMNEIPRAKGESSFDHMKRVQAARAVGLVPGVLDLMFYWDMVLHVIDIKVGNDVLSAAQLKFMAAIKEQGGEAYVVSTLEGGKAVISDIIEPKEKENLRCKM